jgi:superfamily II DNA or RNA helicase
MVNENKNELEDNEEIEDDKKVINSIQEYKELFLSAFMSLKSIETHEDLNHILIYTNSTNSAEIIKRYIDLILKLNILNINKDNYYNKALHSGNTKDTDVEVKKFKNATWGIISSVYIFGEGFDCPKLYGVVFAENMESDIRIVQCALRPNRLDKQNPDKKSYIILPYIDTMDFTIDKNSFDKCRKIISKIRNVDENIIHKIDVCTLTNSKKKPTINPEPNPNPIPNNSIKLVDYIHNSEELEKIKLRLRYSKALSSKCSEEQDEFNYVRALNKELNIQSKEEYADKVIKDKHKNYIENPEEYFKSKCVWSNWYDFIGVDTKKFIQDKNDWINFCKEKEVNSLEKYKELCKLYEKLPINPVDFYIGCLDIDVELDFNTKRRTYSE